MTSRLDTQRAPSKRHVRTTGRKYKRGYDLSEHAPWGDSMIVTAQAAPGSTYPPDPNVTASDAPNAAKLVGLGYVATPQTAWTTGQKITIGTFDFNWTSSAWAAGTHA